MTEPTVDKICRQSAAPMRGEQGQECLRQTEEFGELRPTEDGQTMTGSSRDYSEEDWMDPGRKPPGRMLDTTAATTLTGTMFAVASGLRRLLTTVASTVVTAVVEVPLNALEVVSQVALVQGGVPQEMEDILEDWTGLRKQEDLVAPERRPIEDGDTELADLIKHKSNGYVKISRNPGIDSREDSNFTSLATTTETFPDTIVFEEERMTVRHENKRKRLNERKKETTPTTPLTSTKKSTRASPGPSRSSGNAGWQATISTIMTTLLMAMTISTSIIDPAEAAANGKEYLLENREYNPGAIPNITFTAYDCTVSPDGIYSAIDLGKIGTCKDINHDYEEPTNDTKITMVQTNVPMNINVTGCKMTLNKRVTWHGMSGHIYKSHRFIRDKAIFVPREACLGMLEHRAFVCPSELCLGRPSPLVRIPEDKPGQVTWNTYGSWQDLSAYPESFVPEGHNSLVYAMEEATLDIELTKYTGYVDFSTDILTIPSLNRRLDHDLTYAQFHDIGLLAWKKIRYQCNSTLSRISTNNATIYRLKPESQEKGADHPLTGAMVIVRDSKEDRSSGMIIKKGRHPCLTQCFKTNVRDLLLCIGDVEGVDDVAERPATSATRINMQAMSTLLYMTNKLDRYELGARMSASTCDLDSRTIGQDLASLLNTRNPYALHGIQLSRQGKRMNLTQAITVRGSVGYLHNCTATAARLVPVSNCTQQIPCEVVDRVTGKPKLAFADPINFHLLDYPTVVACTSGMPVQYHINGARYCHDPEHRSCPAGTEPNVLKPTVSAGTGGILSGDFDGLTGLTITPDQLERIRQVHKTTEHGDVVLTGIVKTVSGNTLGIAGGEPVGIHLGMPLTRIDIEHLTGSVAGQMFFLFRLLGQFYLHLFGIMIVVSICQYIFNSGYRLYFVWKHNDKRFGLYLLKAFFAVLFSSAVLPGLILVAVGKAVRDRLDEDRQNLISDPDYAAYKDRVAFTERSIDNIRALMIEQFQGDRDSEEYKGLIQSLYPAEQLKKLRKRQLEEEEATAPVAGAEGILEEFSNRTTGTRSKEDKWTGPKHPGVLETLSEAGARDVCQEFVPKVSRGEVHGSDEHSARKKRLEESKDLIKIIHTKTEDAKNEQDLFDKELKRQEEEDYPKRSKTVDKKNEERRRKIHEKWAEVRELEARLEEILQKEPKGGVKK